MRTVHLGRCLIALALTICAITSLLAPKVARGQTASSSMSPTVRVHGQCLINVTQPATITYDPIVANATSPATGTATVNVQCTPNASATLDLDHGQNASAQGAYYAPNMKGSTSAALLQYFVYSDNGYTNLWGTTTSANAGSSGGALLNIGGNGSYIGYTMYISIPAAQNVPADTFTDTMTATVTY